MKIQLKVHKLKIIPGRPPVAENKPEVFDFDGVELLRIGRTSGEIRIEDSQCSREHACIEKNMQGQLTVKDCGSKNGTFVNALRINTETKLSVGDVIGIGPFRIEVVSFHSGSVENTTDWQDEKPTLTSVGIYHSGPKKYSSRERARTPIEWTGTDPKRMGKKG